MAIDWPGTLAMSELDKLRLESAVDQSVRDRLISDPAALLAERGISVGPGISVSVVEDTATSHTITIPPYVGSDLSDKSLQAQVGSATTWECTTCTPTSPICAGSLASLTCLGNK